MRSSGVAASASATSSAIRSSSEASRPNRRCRVLSAIGPSFYAPWRYRSACRFSVRPGARPASRPVIAYGEPWPCGGGLVRRISTKPGTQSRSFSRSAKKLHRCSAGPAYQLLIVAWTGMLVLSSPPPVMSEPVTSIVELNDVCVLQLK